MPHFSPMNWLFIPLFIWMYMLSLMSLIWWLQSPLFPKYFMMNHNFNYFSWKW
uniref:ATP synthase F0 subunit 8 n=1 Tax=Gesiella jameensis TaxID=1960709 RepID=A0A8E7IW65_9ANNE|nr:ATP synthase F0 subunit 8 [Gesiella jameensis]